MFGSWYNTSRLHFVTVAPDVLRTLVTTTATREIHRVHFSAIEYSVFSLTNCHCQLHARVNPQKDVSPNQAESFGNALRYRLSPGGTRHELFFWHQTTAARCRKQELSSIMTLSSLTSSKNIYGHIQWAHFKHFACSRTFRLRRISDQEQALD